jgi:hypothetical protein
MAVVLVLIGINVIAFLAFGWDNGGPRAPVPRASLNGR